MIEEGFEKGGDSSRGMYIRSTSDILLKGRIYEIRIYHQIGRICRVLRIYCREFLKINFGGRKEDK